MALAVASLRAAAAAGGSPVPLQAARGWLCSLLFQHVESNVQLAVPSCSRAQHIMARPSERQQASVVPEAILQELRELEGPLLSSSRLDGRQRTSLRLSASSLPAPLPPHDVEPGLPCLTAHVRPPQAVGGTASKWLRRAGRVPGRVHSIVGGGSSSSGTAAAEEASSSQAAAGGGQGKEEAAGRPWELLLHFDENELGKMIRSFGRNGCTARVLQLNLARPTETLAVETTTSSTSSSPSSSSSAAAAVSSSPGQGELLGVMRVKPVRVHMNAVTQRLEGVDLLYCPPDRVVLVDVPVRLVNDDLAPGVKKGGWMCVYRRTVRYKALGGAVPPYIEVNVRHMELEQEILIRDLPVPPGTKIYEKNYNAPVLKCTTDVGKD
ncbi:hypothetical protein Agub_g11417 [Astrephomene gubernaculifera]|uniref:Large ribosomal subunit protein bL25 beta domain-containing protein n=1 Tax=Astrephomene gubernaculifera TaxID=47775 RepID=A0AAD3DZG6_9CHLO|nr:hypothetical protein Agub_g11417 [Astrephomene gubernaculifera]